jgi:hypothetical protein
MSQQIGPPKVLSRPETKIFVLLSSEDPEEGCVPSRFGFEFLIQV